MPYRQRDHIIGYGRYYNSAQILLLELVPGHDQLKPIPRPLHPIDSRCLAPLVVSTCVQPFNLETR